MVIQTKTLKVPSVLYLHFLASESNLFLKHRVKINYYKPKHIYNLKCLAKYYPLSQAKSILPSIPVPSEQ